MSGRRIGPLDFSYTDDLEGISVLLVEDEAILAIDVTAIIEMAGGRVVGPAYSLGQGFSWIDRGKFDCAVLDINLHNELAFDLADALIERRIPILFLSSHSLNIAPPHLQQRRLVHKPFSTHSLIRAIRAEVAERRTVDIQQPATEQAVVSPPPSPTGRTWPTSAPRR
jgi:DNA-binding response OmpR family regulator